MKPAARSPAAEAVRRSRINHRATDLSPIRAHAPKSLVTTCNLLPRPSENCSDKPYLKTFGRSVAASYKLLQARLAALGGGPTRVGLALH